VKIVDAIQTWNDRTDAELYVDANATLRIRIRPKNADDPSSSCFAEGLGRPKGDGIRTLVIGRECGRGSIQHELGHALGLAHEHQRWDRNDHLVFRNDNIVLDRRGSLGNYRRKGSEFGEYDYRSIMHYSEKAFARSMCCQDSGHSGDFDSAAGLPAGCDFFDMVGTDLDDDDRYDPGDSCPADRPFEVELTVMKPRRQLPNDPALELGQRLAPSKGDAAAVNALGSEGGLEARDYNALSTLQAQPSADYLTQHVADVNGGGLDDLVSFAKGPGTQAYQGDVEVSLGDAEGRLEPAGVCTPTPAARARPAWWATRTATAWTTSSRSPRAGPGRRDRPPRGLGRLQQPRPKRERCHLRLAGDGALDRLDRLAQAGAVGRTEPKPGRLPRPRVRSLSRPMGSGPRAAGRRRTSGASDTPRPPRSAPSCPPRGAGAWRGRGSRGWSRRRG